MCIKRIIFPYLFVFVAVISMYPAVVLSYSPSSETATQYIKDISNSINKSVDVKSEGMLYGSKGNMKLKIYISPWGELKDAYVSESSGSKQLDDFVLKSVWSRERYQPFPEELGDNDEWLEIPVVFSARDDEIFESELKEEWFTIDKSGKEANVSGIEDAIDVALENNFALKIAQDEIALSRLKIKEARRALYPSATFNYMETTGMTTEQTQDFTDKEYKMKFEYPLFYGWRLKYAVDQARTNMKASRYSYNKTMNDVRAETETAFYSYLAARINARVQRAMLKDINDIFEKAGKRFDMELSTKSEFLKVQSQMRQIRYQMTSSENDLELARLTLSQAMGLGMPEDLSNVFDIDIDIMDLEPIDIGVSLEQCMDLAFRNRQDLKAKEYSLDSSEYEMKIAQSKNQLKVDLTGTYGRSGGAYASETLELSKDWYLGIKVTKPFGGNTLSTSYTKDQTSEKHGQSSRTESVSKAVEVGFLDNLQSISENKSADIAYKKAKDELDKVKEAIIKDVRETYLNYRKGLVQTGANFNKIKQREEELRVARARADLNEIPYSELIQAYMNLTDEKSYYIEAMGSLYQSMAKLNRATGYSLFLDSESFMLANAGK